MYNRIILLLVGTALVVGGLRMHNANAATIYSAGSLLQIGDVKTEHILNGTIVDADVSASASIASRKVTTQGTTGTVLLTDGTRVATTTSLKFATSTADLYVFGGRVHASSTNFNGVSHSWPSADGTNGQALATNGSGTLSWTTLSSQSIVGVFTAGESITAGDTVAVASSSHLSRTRGNDNTAHTAVNGATWISYATTTEASGVSEIVSFTMTYKNSCGGAQEWTFVGYIEADNAGSPSGTILAAATSTLNLSNCAGGALTFTPSAPLAVSAGTTYHFVVHQSTSNGVGGFMAASPSQSPNAKTSGDSGQTWGDAGYSASFGYTYSDVQNGRIYKASAAASDWKYKQFVGLAKSTVTAGQSVSVDMLGLSTATSSLATSTSYFLSNTAGQLSTSAGSNSLKIGTYIGYTGFLMRPVNP